MAAPSHVNEGTVTSTAFGSSLTPALPASITTGNLLLAVGWGATAPSALNSNIASGWTKLGDFITATGSDFISIWWRIATGSDSAPTMTLGANSSWAAIVYQFTGVYASDPFGNYDSARSAASASPLEIDGLSPSRTDSLALVHLICDDGTQAPATPSSYTSEYLIENVTAAFRAGAARLVSYVYVDGSTPAPDISTTFPAGQSTGWRLELVSIDAPAQTPRSIAVMTGM